jgi:hypothetical protein
MTDTRIADEWERELQETLRTATPARDAIDVLARLVRVFDGRRRRRDAIAIIETARAASEAVRQAS